MTKNQSDKATSEKATKKEEQPEAEEKKQPPPQDDQAVRQARKEPERPAINSQKEAEALAKKYVPKSDKDRYEKVTRPEKADPVKIDKYDVLYVTEDCNVFMKDNEGSARSHASRHNLKIFEVKN